MLYEVINSFRDEHAYLSNFWMAEVRFPDGQVYPSSEHAYQAQKTLDVASRLRIAALKQPGAAKREGSMLDIRPDWNMIRVQVMFHIVLLKFEQHPDLAEKLIATGDTFLEEGNHWNDKFWGTVEGKGRNILGNILMNVRAILRDRKKVKELNQKITAYWVGDPMMDTPLSDRDLDRINQMIGQRDALANKIDQALAMHGSSDILTHYT